MRVRSTRYSRRLVALWRETECYVKGYAGNERDGIYRRATASKGGQMLPVEFAPVKGSRIGELAAKFEIVLGYTPTS
jgi:protocatechuate 3,4-dioxygenase, beta subunit